MVSFEDTARDTHYEQERERIREEVMQWLVNLSRLQSCGAYSVHRLLYDVDIDTLFGILGDNAPRAWQDELDTALNEGKPNG